MPTIFDYVNSNEISAFYQESVQGQLPYLGATLFPARKQNGLELRWIKAAGGLPVALAPSAFDAKAPVRDRIGFSDVVTEMPFFRESMRIGEKDRQQILTFLASNRSDAVRTLMARIYDDAATLVKGADVQPERMRMQLLSTGKIEIQANRVNYTYDYMLPAENTEELLTTDRWSESTSTPVQDLIAWMDAIEDSTGARPTNAIMSRKTFGYLSQHASIRADINPVGAANIIMTDTMVRDYLFNKLGLRVAVYNKKFVDEAGVKKSFFPDDVVTLFPDGELGNTYYGTTPEEADLQNGETAAEVTVVNTGVAVTTYKEPHPVNVVTVVSEIVLPSFERIDEVFIAKVN